MPEQLSPYTLCTIDTLGRKGNTLSWVFNMDEFRDDSISKGIAIAAATLIFWRKYPYLRRVRFLAILSRAWIELRAFISNERGKLYTHFVADVIRELPEMSLKKGH